MVVPEALGLLRVNMPTIPAPAEVMTVTPSDQPLRGFDINASPAAFGAARAAGLEKVGRAGQETAIYWKGLQNETEAKQGDIKANDAALKYLFDPKTGFMTKMKQDAALGYQDAFKQLDQIFADTRKGLTNDEARRMYDASAVRSLRSFQMAAADHAAREHKSWMIDTAESQIQNKITKNAVFVNNPDMFKQGLEEIAAISLQRDELMGQKDPAEIEKNARHYQSESIMAAVHYQMPTDLRSAREFFQYAQDNNMIDAPHAAAIEQSLQNHEHTKILMENAQHDREEREAQKQLQKKQLQNEAQIYADFQEHKPIDWHEIAEMTRRQDISLQFAHMMEVEARHPGEGSVEAENALWKKFATKTLTVDDIDSTPHLPSGARSTFYRAVGGEIKEFQQHAYNYMKTALQGGAVEQGQFTNRTDAGDKAIMWSQAQREFWNRVGDGEDPQKAADDIVSRYMKVPPRPSNLPNPRGGPVENVMQLTERATKLAKGKADGTVGEDEYQTELHILARWREYFDEVERSNIAGVKKATAAESKTMGGAEEQKPNPTR